MFWSKKSNSNKKSIMLKELATAKEVLGSKKLSNNLKRAWIKSKPSKSQLRKIVGKVGLFAAVTATVFGSVQNSQAQQTNSSANNANIENTQGFEESRSLDPERVISKVIQDFTVIEEFIVAEKYDEALNQVNSTRNDINSLGKGVQRALSNALSALDNLEKEILEKQGISFESFKVSELEGMSRGDFFNEELRIRSLFRDAIGSNNNSRNQELFNYFAKVQLVSAYGRGENRSLSNMQNNEERVINERNSGMKITSVRSGNVIEGTIEGNNIELTFSFQLN